MIFTKKLVLDEKAPKTGGVGLARSRPAWKKPGQMAWPGFGGLEKTRPLGLVFVENQANWPGLVFAGLAWPGHFF